MTSLDDADMSFEAAEQEFVTERELFGELEESFDWAEEVEEALFSGASQADLPLPPSASLIPDTLDTISLESRARIQQQLRAHTPWRRKLCHRRRGAVQGWSAVARLASWI